MVYIPARGDARPPAGGWPDRARPRGRSVTDPSVLPPVEVRRPGRPSDLTGFLADHLVSPDGGRITRTRGRTGGCSPEKGASAAALGASWSGWAGVGPAPNGSARATSSPSSSRRMSWDFDGTSAIAAADTDAARARPAPNRRSRHATSPSGSVELADYGCRVVVFLDGVHELPGEGVAEHDQAVGAGPAAGAAGHHVRGLQGGPEPGGKTRSRGCSPSARRTPSSPPVAGPYTLEAFQRPVRAKEVLDLSERGQEVGTLVHPDRGRNPKTLFAQP